MPASQEWSVVDEAVTTLEGNVLQLMLQAREDQEQSLQLNKALASVKYFFYNFVFYLRQMN